MNRLVPLSLAALLLLLASSSPAQDMPVSVEMQYSLFVRTLSFDRSLQDDKSRKIVIGVLYQEGVRTSMQAKEEFLSAADQSDIKTLFGRPIDCIAVSANDTPLGVTLKRLGVAVLYVSPLRTVDIATIADDLANTGILSITGVPEYVQDGIAIGVGNRGGRPAILVNLREAKRQGADLSSQLLRVAVLIDEP